MTCRRPWIGAAALLVLAGCSMSPPSAVDDLLPGGFGGGAPSAPRAPEPVAVPAGTPEAPRLVEPAQDKTPPAQPTPAPASPPAASPSASTEPVRRPLRLPIGLSEVSPPPPRIPSGSPAALPGLGEAATSVPLVARSPRLGAGEAEPLSVPGLSVALPEPTARPPHADGLSAAALDPGFANPLPGASAQRASLEVGLVQAIASSSGQSPGLAVTGAAPVVVSSSAPFSIQPSDVSPRITARRGEVVALPSPGVGLAGVRAQASASPVIAPSTSPALVVPAAGQAQGVVAPSHGRALSVVIGEAATPEVDATSRLSVHIVGAPRADLLAAVNGVPVVVRGASPLPAAAHGQPVAASALQPSPAASADPRAPANRQGDATVLTRWLRDHFPFLF